MRPDQAKQLKDGYDALGGPLIAIRPFPVMPSRPSMGHFLLASPNRKGEIARSRMIGNPRMRCELAR